MDDGIIYSWCFNSIECFDSTPSTVIIILVEDLESFSSLRSQQGVRGAFLLVGELFLNWFNLSRSSEEL